MLSYNSMEKSNIVAREKYNTCYTHIEVIVLYVSKERARKKVAGYFRRLGKIEEVAASSHASSSSSTKFFMVEIDHGKHSAKIKFGIIRGQASIVKGLAMKLASHGQKN